MILDLEAEFVKWFSSVRSASHASVHRSVDFNHVRVRPYAMRLPYSLITSEGQKAPESNHDVEKSNARSRKAILAFHLIFAVAILRGAICIFLPPTESERLARVNLSLRAELMNKTNEFSPRAPLLTIACGVNHVTNGFLPFKIAFCSSARLTQRTNIVV